MKFFLLLILFLFQKPSAFFTQEFTGMYKIEYDYDYESQNGLVKINNSTYVRELSNGSKVFGTIDFQKYFVTLTDVDSTLQVKFPSRLLGKDTIYFRTVNLKDKSSKETGLTVFAGKLIKQKG